MLPSLAVSLCFTIIISFHQSKNPKNRGMLGYLYPQRMAKLDRTGHGLQNLYLLNTGRKFTFNKLRDSIKQKQKRPMFNTSLRLCFFCPAFFILFFRLLSCNMGAGNMYLSYLPSCPPLTSHLRLVSRVWERHDVECIGPYLLTWRGEKKQTGSCELILN